MLSKINKASKLTAADLEVVKSSWNVVMKNPEDNGVVILRAFLEKYNYYSKFEKFEGIPIPELPTKRIFRRHAAAILNSINNVIMHLDNEGIMRADLHALGKMHAKKRITHKEFEELKATILQFLEATYDLPDSTITAWNKTLNLAFAYIEEGLTDPSD